MDVILPLITKYKAAKEKKAKDLLFAQILSRLDPAIKSTAKRNPIRDCEVSDVYQHLSIRLVKCLEEVDLSLVRNDREFMGHFMQRARWYIVDLKRREFRIKEEMGATSKATMNAVYGMTSLQKRISSVGGEQGEIHQFIASEKPDPYRIAAAREELDHLIKQLDLTPQLLRIFTASYIDGRTHKDIASEMNFSESRISQLNREILPRLNALRAADGLPPINNRFRENLRSRTPISSELSGNPLREPTKEEHKMGVRLLGTDNAYCVRIGYRKRTTDRGSQVFYIGKDIELANKVAAFAMQEWAALEKGGHRLWTKEAIDRVLRVRGPLTRGPKKKRAC